MQLTDKQIEEFQQLYEKHYGIALSKVEALEQATKLVRLTALIYQPMSKEQFIKLQERIEFIKTK